MKHKDPPKPLGFGGAWEFDGAQWRWIKHTIAGCEVSLYYLTGRDIRHYTLQEALEAGDYQGPRIEVTQAAHYPQEGRIEQPIRGEHVFLWWDRHGAIQTRIRRITRRDLEFDSSAHRTPVNQTVRKALSGEAITPTEAADALANRQCYDTFEAVDTLVALVHGAFDLTLAPGGELVWKPRPKYTDQRAPDGAESTIDSEGNVSTSGSPEARRALVVQLAKHYPTPISVSWEEAREIGLAAEADTATHYCGGRLYRGPGWSVYVRPSRGLS